ncbi:FAD-binding oxidoreductase [Aquabacterium sp.]|uniref:FAD-binding oxidoreductase n=1 Tax=Aquabacterium sp. TaxID=1872578 RepID=UPI0025C03831|nr:FAD-binding oxidoreductase [Aquabacterium sp.]
MAHAELIQALQAALGPHAVRQHNPSEPDALRPYLNDWRQRYAGQALAVVKPGSTDEVAQVVRLCAAHGVSLVPQGGNTSLVGGSVPDTSGKQIVLSLQGLNRIRDIDPANLSMTVEAGCVLAQVQAAADEADLLFPLSLAAEGSCTIGGNLATNAGGTQVLRYGTARELCLGIEAVTAQGEIWHGLKSLRKDNTGYDLRDLLIGSEGTLGIITAASLRLYPKPASRMAALVSVGSVEQALALLGLARRQLDAHLTGFELMHQHPLQLLARHLPAQAKAMQGLCADPSAPEPSTPPAWLILIDAASSQPDATLSAQLEELLSEALASGLASNALVSTSDSQYRAMWALREAIPLAEKAEGLMVKHDIAVPTSRVPEFLAQALPSLHARFPGCRVVCFGHLGDGNLHFNVQGPATMADRDFLAAHEHEVNKVVYDIAMAMGGTLSAEHGIGQLKRDELAQRQDPIGRAWMRAIKQTLDPLGTLNPGRLIA